MSSPPSTSGPDLAQGVAIDDLAPQGLLLGHVGDESVLLVRRGERFFAVGANCTHYGGPLAEGIVEDDAVRCPWHHACFDLETGEAVRAPALSPLPCWSVLLACTFSRQIPCFLWCQLLLALESWQRV